VFLRFKDLADKKKQIGDADLEALVMDMVEPTTELFKLDALQVTCGTPGMPTASVRLIDKTGEIHVAAAIGTGPVDSVYKAIDTITGASYTLQEFVVQAITEGIDAVGEVSVRITRENLRTEQARRTFTGHGVDLDIIVASAKAYLNAINKLLQAPEESTIAAESRQARRV